MGLWSFDITQAHHWVYALMIVRESQTIQSRLCRPKNFSIRKTIVLNRENLDVASAELRSQRCSSSKVYNISKSARQTYFIQQNFCMELYEHFNWSQFLPVELIVRSFYLFNYHFKPLKYIINDSIESVIIESLIPCITIFETVCLI